MKIETDLQLNKKLKSCLMFFQCIYPLSVVTFGFDRPVTVCLHV